MQSRNERRVTSEIDATVTKEIHTHWITASGLTGSTGSMSGRFPFWSFTKTVIAFCALKLAEDGALELDEPLVTQKFSLRHSLTHTTGLPDYGQLEEYGMAVRNADPPWSRADMLDLTLRSGMLFPVGKGWSYSNVGYMFAREIIEDVAGTDFAPLAARLLFEPLQLPSVEIWKTAEQSNKLHWSAAANYDPKWVYHQCLIGTAPDAARLLHSIFTECLIKPESLGQMTTIHPLGGPLPNRPWTTCGYGLGLMSGTVEGLGRVIGHSGAGPFCVNAVYHFPDLPNPTTVASFTDGCDEGVAEFAAVEIAKTF